VGSRHDKPHCRCRSGPRRPRARICLRKGCGRKYTPQRWNQRYCQDPECLRLVRRWQAARRQAKRRQDDAAKAQHAEAQRARRRRLGSSPQLPKQPEVATARGHAAKIFSRLLCATGRGVMNRSASQAATRRATAAPPAVKPFAGCSIANASGCGAALFQAAARAIGSTRPRAPSAAACHTTHPTRRRRGKSGPQPRRSAVDSFTPQAP